MIRKRVIVHGQVQGVGFRWHTRAEAGRLGLAGWVQNLPDGTVEVEVAGEEGMVDRMLDWLRHGPKHAHVDRIQVSAPPPDAETADRGFSIR